VILPARNRRDLEDIPQSTRSMLEFVWVERVDEALEVALGEPLGSSEDSDERPMPPPKASKNARAEKAAVLAAPKS
jgi:ATP-dependent Lon protease